MGNSRSGAASNEDGDPVSYEPDGEPRVHVTSPVSFGDNPPSPNATEWVTVGGRRHATGTRSSDGPIVVTSAEWVMIDDKRMVQSLESLSKFLRSGHMERRANGRAQQAEYLMLLAAMQLIRRQIPVHGEVVPPFYNEVVCASRPPSEQLLACVDSALATVERFGLTSDASTRILEVLFWRFAKERATVVAFLDERGGKLASVAEAQEDLVRALRKMDTDLAPIAGERRQVANERFASALADADAAISRWIEHVRWFLLEDADFKALRINERDFKAHVTAVIRALTEMDPTPWKVVHSNGLPGMIGAVHAEVKARLHALETMGRMTNDVRATYQ